MSLQNIANHLAQHGRGNDTVLVHMTPKEVGGLQQLAQSHGGSLTTNPHTGLPEAGFLDKLLPTIIGGAIMAATDGAVQPWMIGLGVGGVEAARTGNLGQGLMAGLGAYGGAGLTSGLMGLGANAIGEAAGANALSTAGANVGDEALAANEAATNAVAKAGPMSTLGSGIQSAYNDPSAALKAMGGGWNVAQKGLMAAAPMMTASQPTVSMPGKIVNPNAYIQTKMFNPYTKQFTDVSKVQADQFGNRTFADERNNADLSKYVTAADGGLMGMTPGQFNYAQMQPAVDLHSSIGVNPSNAGLTQPQNMAEGGVAHFDDGGPAFSNQQISDYVSNIQAQGGGDKEIAAAMDKYGVNTNQLANALGANVADVQSRYNAADTTGGYYTGASGISNNQIKDYLATPGLADATIYNAMQQYGVTPQQMAYATGNPLAGENNIQDRYDLAGALTQATGQGGNLYGEAVGHSPNALDPQAVAWMDTHKDASGKVDPITVQEVARITGMPVADVQYRYDLVKNAKAPVTPIVPVVQLPTNIGTKTGTNTSNPATTATNAIQNTPASTLARGVSGNTGAGIEGGGTVINPNGTITESPVIPGIPQGGFTGMQNLIDSYTSRGGSTGYMPKAPTTMDEFNARYNTLSGGSKAAFDYLSGAKGANYPIVPSTSTGQIMQPYDQSVLGVPQSATIPATQKYFVDSKTHRLTLNPAYNAATGSNSNSSSSSGPALNSGKTISIPVANGTPPKNATQLKDYPGIYYGVDGLYYDANGNVTTDPTQQAANGGLMGMAHGGSTNEYNLGSYSDGGRLLRGPGDGVSDSIPATIGKGQPARLADGEFVVPARIVSELGNGSTEAGAKQLYAMMDRIQKARSRTVGKGKVATNTKAAKYLPA
jgi:hypothetical protein